MNTYAHSTIRANTTFATFETTNRKLEQFLFVHDIPYLRWYKRPSDGMTAWVYPDTADVQSVVDEYKEICRRRHERRTAACVQ